MDAIDDYELGDQLADAWHEGYQSDWSTRNPYAGTDSLLAEEWECGRDEARREDLEFDELWMD